MRSEAAHTVDIGHAAITSEPGAVLEIVATAPEPEFHAVEDLLRRSAVEAEEQLETARTKAREAQRRVELLEPVVRNWHQLLAEYHQSRAVAR